MPQNLGKKVLFAGVVAIQGFFGDTSLDPNRLRTGIREPLSLKRAAWPQQESVRASAERAMSLFGRQFRFLQRTEQFVR